MGYSSTRGSRSKSATERYGRHRLNKSLNTRCVVTIGILLPIVGAIIGVAAWAIGNESVHVDPAHRKSSSMFYNTVPLRFRNDLFQERNDHLLNEQQKVPIGSSVFINDLGSKMIHESEEKESNTNLDSRDILENIDYHSTSLPSHPQEDHQQKDPLYVVHYVPQELQPEVTSPKTVQEPSVNTDVLSKILSASKASGQKTPQFVVFAPMPADISPPSFSEGAERSPDYDDYEEHQERPVFKKNRFKKRRKHGKNLRLMDREEAESSEMEQIRPYGSRHQLPISDDISQGGTHQSHRSVNILKKPQNVQSFNHQNAHHVDQQNADYVQPQHHQYKQQQQRHRQYEHHLQQHHQQLLTQQATGPRHPQQPCCDAEPSNFNHAPFPQASSSYGAPHLPLSSEYDADRHGHVSPSGLTITLGGGQGGGGGGSVLPISPLGILRQLLRPLNPTFDLKKKLFFGVQLENGFGLGGNEQPKPANGNGKGDGKGMGKHIDLTIGR